jgi:hypothetical protein
MVSEKARVHNNSDIKRQIRHRRWELASLSLFPGLIKQNTTQFPLPKDYKPCNACLPAFFVNSFSPTTAWD